MHLSGKPSKIMMGDAFWHSLLPVRGISQVYWPIPLFVPSVTHAPKPYAPNRCLVDVVHKVCCGPLEKSHPGSCLPPPADGVRPSCSVRWGGFTRATSGNGCTRATSTPQGHCHFTSYSPKMVQMGQKGFSPTKPKASYAGIHDIGATLYGIPIRSIWPSPITPFCITRRPIDNLPGQSANRWR